MKKAGFAAVLVVLALLAARVAHADASFTDPAGDSGSAPDITTMTVTDDPAGNITFSIATNQPTLAPEMLVGILVDQDGNLTTGDLETGTDALFVLRGDSWSFLRWSDASFTFVEANASSATALYANGVATFKINRADLGGTDHLGVIAVSVQVDAAGSIAATDLAPDTGVAMPYFLTSSPPTPVPLTLRASTPKAPKPAKAGRAFVVRTNVVRGDTGAPLASGKVACRVTLGLKPLRAAGTLKAGAASCTMALPRTAHGKRIRGTITVTFNGKSVTKPFGFRVP